MAAVVQKYVRHIATGRIGTVPASALAYWLTRGYELVAPGEIVQPPTYDERLEHVEGELAEKLTPDTLDDAVDEILSLPSGKAASKLFASIAQQAFDPDDAGYDIVLCLGQSLMSGPGTDWTNGQDNALSDRVWQYGSPANPSTLAGRISRASIPMIAHSSPDGMGHMTHYAQWRVERMKPNRRLLLVPASHGGTSLVTDETPLGWRWGIEGNLSAQAVAQALAALAAAGPNSRIVEVLWAQGEGDAGIGGAAGYQADFDALVPGINAALGQPDLPWTIFQMMPEGIDVNAYKQTINRIQIDTPRRILNTSFVYSPRGFQQPGSDNHPTAEFFRITGRDGATGGLDRALANVLGVAPVVPLAPVLTQSSATVAVVSWAQLVGRVTDFNVRYRINGGSWTNLTRTQSIDARALLTGLTAPTAIEAQVRSVNEEGVSGWSPTSAALTLVSAPSQVAGLAAGTPTPYACPLTWTVGSGGATYLIEKSTDSGTTWTSAGTSTKDGTGIATGLPQDTSGIRLRVTASNVAGSGAASTSVTVTTPSAPLLLDALTALGAPVKFAYSENRKLRSAYAGAGFRVRRSSDSTEQDIGFVGGVVDTAALLTFCGAGDGFVTKVYDQSTNANHRLQATAANQRKIVSSGALVTVGGHLAAPWADATDNETFTAFPNLYAAAAAGGAALLGVMKVNTAGNQRWYIESASGNANAAYALGAIAAVSSNWALQTAIRNAENAAILASIDTAAMTTTGLHQVAICDTGNAVTRYHDGAGTSPVAYNLTGTMSGINVAGIGAKIAPTVSLTLLGSVPELVGFDGPLADEARMVGQANQKDFYGTP